MDKGSYHFAAYCGVCHPGGGALQYDRGGKPYFDRATGRYGYDGGATGLPASPAGSPPGAAQLDGDYAFVNPQTGVPGVADWAKSGVSEADCLLCHLTQYATAPGTADHDRGLSWHKRAATMRSIGVPGVVSFEWAPTAGAGWARVAYVTGASPPLATAVTIDYGLGVAAGTLVAQGGALVIPLGKVGPARDQNCRGCHATPDGKKSGRTLLAGNDVHVAGGVACTRCHVTPDGGVKDRFGLADANPHQIGKGDAIIGSVRNDLDGTVLGCADCHLDGADPLAPDPEPKHRSLPRAHLGFMTCQVCHVRHLDDDPASPTQDVPELVIEMTSNGTQNVSIWSAYLGTDPLDPALALPELSDRPFRWYPALRWRNGTLKPVKPLLTTWYGDWVGGTGDLALIRPLPLRLVRKALTDGYAPGTARLASLSLTPGTKAPARPVLHRKDEVRAFLLALRAAEDTANADVGANAVAVRPVLVRAGRVYHLNGSDEVEFFESHVAERHDFSVSHNVVARRDPANPVVSPGPWGAGGCNDCHGPRSPFFHGKQLAEAAQYDYLDPQGTVPNPDAGAPAYASQHEIMGYTDLRAAQLTARRVPVQVTVAGAFGAVTFEEVGGGEASSCAEADGACTIGVTPGATVRFAAVAEPGATLLGFSGCTAAGDGTCSVMVGVPASGVSNRGVVVGVQFSDPVATAPGENALDVRVEGGQGTVEGGGIDCRANAGACAVEVTPPGSSVSLTASAWAGSSFVGWTGCTTASGASCSVTVDRATLVVAEFAPDVYPVSVRTEGTGWGAVTGAGLSCWDGSGTCVAHAAPGAVVTLTAMPGPGSRFVGWADCESASGASCTLTVSGPAGVTARFAAP